MNGSLYLTPRDTGQLPDPDRVFSCLQDLHITGTLLHEAPDKRVYTAGEDFMRHVIYAGCSPHLHFEPQEPHDRNFCHVALLGPYDRPEVITGENTANPRCPHCRSHLADWEEQIHSGQLECLECRKSFPPWQADWRQQAAAGRYFIELRNVFPGEASPGDRLLSELRKATDTEWRYAWAGMSPEP